MPGGWAGRVWLSQAGEFESINDGVAFDVQFNAGNYYANVKADSLSKMGAWTMRRIELWDNASNKSTCLLYDDPYWLANPFGIDDTHYYLYNHEGLLPAQNPTTKITITKY